jgi:hypothetical protein
MPKWTKNHRVELWSLEIANAFRASVVAKERVGEPKTYTATLNNTHLGEYPDPESAIARVETNLFQEMQLVERAWGTFLDYKK